MDFQNLKTKVCPSCGSEVIEEGLETSSFDGRPKQHVNGQRWETRRFACGYGVQWIPNFEREASLGECKHDPAIVDRRKKYDALLLSLRKKIEASTVDEETKKRLLWKLL
jgi:hypothetical protein